MGNQEASDFCSPVSFSRAPSGAITTEVNAGGSAKRERGRRIKEQNEYRDLAENNGNASFIIYILMIRKLCIV